MCQAANEMNAMNLCGGCNRLAASSKQGRVALMLLVALTVVALGWCRLCAADNAARTSGISRPLSVRSSSCADDAPFIPEVVHSSQYHHAIKASGQAPLLMAYLNETSAEHSIELHAFRTAAQAAHCLAPGGIKAMHAGADARAVFIASEDGIRQPALSLFIGGRRKEGFPGPWNAQVVDQRTAPKPN